jgi:hypothetical protein
VKITIVCEILVNSYKILIEKKRKVYNQNTDPQKLVLEI